MIKQALNSCNKLIQLTSFTFAKDVQTNVKANDNPKNLTFYKNGQLTTRTAITLKKTEDIESYVIKTLQNYFRTTYRQGLTLESKLIDHGLDSLDQIEIAMQIQQDLGYVISAQTLPVLQKVKHFVNYIEQVEQFKKQNNSAPLG